MNFKKLKIKNSYLITRKPFIDDRGFFARTYCNKEYSNFLKNKIVQTNLSYNKSIHTLRGLHYQIKSSAEDRILHFIKGDCFTVIIDLRKNSKTYMQKIELKVSSKKHNSIIVPKGCANGFLTLTKNTYIAYQVTSSFSPNNYCGIRYNDPTFKIKWPYRPKVISQKDLNLPDYKDKHNL